MENIAAKSQWNEWKSCGDWQIPEAIARMLMRYSSIASGGQHWNIPYAVYQRLVEAHGLAVEGFASPVNSQTMRWRHKADSHLRVAHPTGFCSLFPDVDKPFGSLGSHFDYDFAGTTSTIFPPGTLDIMDTVVRRCVKTLDRAAVAGTPTRMFFEMPDWTDTYYFRELSTSKYLEASFQLRSNEYYFENSNDGDTVIPARFPSSFFVLSTGYAPADYSDVQRAFRWPMEN